MERIDLDGDAWYLAWYPGLEWFIRNDHKNERLLGFISAMVPGTVQNDLMDAGIIPDVYRDTNSMLSEWTSGRNWLYKRFIDLDRDVAGKRVRVRFEGVDYYATYFLNGVKLGESSNMFEPAEFDVTPILKADGRNVLAVAIDEPPREQCQIGRTSLVRTVKARFSYWWDFATRIIPSGIWDSVALVIDDGISFGDDLVVRTDVEPGFGKAAVTVGGSLRSIRAAVAVLEAELRLDGRTVCRASTELSVAPGSTRFSTSFEPFVPELWQPNGLGGQPLYDVELRLLEGSVELCRAEERFGVRTVERRTNEGFPDPAKYLFVVNGRPVFVKGWNWVPVDMLYGRDRRGTYERLVRLAKDAHVNLLRVWGGGLIEKEIFYRLCDEAGIMVWQEFNNSSSGVDNEPSADPGFLSTVREYAVAAVKKRRNHPCLVVWCGGNELMDAEGVPLDEDRSPILRELSAVVREHGNGRLFVPTSAFGKHAGLNTDTARRKGELWDVHGPWLYQGVREQYRLFNENTCAFHAEFGVEGAVPYRVLRTFLSEENVWPPTRENRAWNHHGSWFIDLERLKEAFGAIDGIEEYCRLGSYLQAEALRYCVESNRARALSCGGTLPWQFNEPFPNAVGTSSVAYGNVPKPAYYFVKKAYAPVHASLGYDSQVFTDEARFDVRFNASVVPSEPVGAEVLAYDSDGKLLNRNVFRAEGLRPEEGLFLGTVAFPCEEDLILVRVRAFAGNPDDRNAGPEPRYLEEPNEYLFVRGNDLSGLRTVPKADVRFVGEGGAPYIANGSPATALFVWTGLDQPDEFFCLLPGERRKIAVPDGRDPGGEGPDWFNR